MDPAKEKEVEDEYLSSLMDLNVNSKPLINMLTMLAEDNLECGHVIVRAIEKHLAQVFTLYKI
jgi:pre-mRNA cleavage complex 2 protein Pcf11